MPNAPLTRMRGGGTGAVLDALLRTLATSRRPVVLVLDDLQWADEATLDVLCLVGRRVAASGRS